MSVLGQLRVSLGCSQALFPCPWPGSEGNTGWPVGLGGAARGFGGAGWSEKMRQGWLWPRGGVMQLSWWWPGPFLLQTRSLAWEEQQSISKVSQQGGCRNQRGAPELGDQPPLSPAVSCSGSCRGLVLAEVGGAAPCTSYLQGPWQMLLSLEPLCSHLDRKARRPLRFRNLPGSHGDQTK